MKILIRIKYKDEVYNIKYIVPRKVLSDHEKVGNLSSLIFNIIKDLAIQLLDKIILD